MRTLPGLASKPQVPSANTMACAVEARAYNLDLGFDLGGRSNKFRKCPMKIYYLRCGEVLKYIAMLGDFWSLLIVGDHFDAVFLT